MATRIKEWLLVAGISVEHSMLEWLLDALRNNFHRLGDELTTKGIEAGEKRSPSRFRRNTMGAQRLRFNLLLARNRNLDARKEVLLGHPDNEQFITMSEALVE